MSIGSWYIPIWSKFSRPWPGKWFSCKLMFKVWPAAPRANQGCWLDWAHKSMGRCWDSPTVPTACWAEQNLSGKDRPRLLQDVLFHEKRNQMNQDGVVTARWLKDSERLWKTLSSLPGPQSPMAFSETTWAKSLVAPTSTAMSRTCSTFRCDPLPEDYSIRWRNAPTDSAETSNARTSTRFHKSSEQHCRHARMRWDFIGSLDPRWCSADQKHLDHQS